MSTHRKIWMLATVAVALGVAWGQDSSSQSSSPTPSATPSATPSETPADNGQQQPLPAYGQENAPPPISENPPLTSLEQPGLEPHAAPLSYLQPGVTVSESASTNIGNNLGGGQSFFSITRALGTLTLERLWSHYDLALNYAGGAGYFNANGLGWKSLQQMDVDQKATWKRGQLVVRDSFSYLPEGNFGGAYGAIGSFGISSLGSLPLSGNLSETAVGALGEAPRVINGSSAEVSEELSPKSAVTALGGYAFTHFYGSDAETGGNFLNSSEALGTVGYNRILTSKTQVAVLAGYEHFNYSIVGSKINVRVAQLLVGHRITGRMDFVAGAGPDLINVEFPITFCTNPLSTVTNCVSNGGKVVTQTFGTGRLGVAARAQLRYRFTKMNADLTYSRSLTSGSGLFAGAQTDLIRLGLSRQLSRVWGAFADLGYSRNSREAPASANVNLGVPGAIFQSGYAGVAIHRWITHSWHAYASYQFNTLWFDPSFCAGASPCNRTSNRQSVTIGVDWRPRPIRID